MKLTSRERIMRIFRNEEIDRPALKLWGHGLRDESGLVHPAYVPIHRRALEVTDLFAGVGFPIDLLAGRKMEEYREVWKEDFDERFYDEHTVLHTPKGDLHQMVRKSTGKEPEYIMEHFVKEPEDVDLILSMEYEPFSFDRRRYDEMIKKVGDMGVVMVALPHVAYLIQILLGSETLAYFSIDYREELVRLADTFTERLQKHVKTILGLGIIAPFSWVGPELFLPPLMTPADFEQFVHDYDKPICDMIHNAGGYVWVHCHGKVSNFIDSFIDMGVDILNPLEPPKNGDIHMGDIISRYGNRIGWEGNIEVQDLIFSSEERVRQLIDECVGYGAQSGRFVLCPSTGYMEIINPSARYLNNLMTYLNYGLESLERYRK